MQLQALCTLHVTQVCVMLRTSVAHHFCACPCDLRQCWTLFVGPTGWHVPTLPMPACPHTAYTRKLTFTKCLQAAGLANLPGAPELAPNELSSRAAKRGSPSSRTPAAQQEPALPAAPPARPLKGMSRSISSPSSSATHSPNAVPTQVRPSTGYADCFDY